MQRVKELREHRGWSQAELAEAAGLKKETIANIESGKWNPRPATREKLERALGCTLEASTPGQKSLGTRIILRGTRIILRPGEIYTHSDMSQWLCLASDISGTARLRRPNDGWTCTAHGVRQRADSRINWEYSSDGHWAEEAKQ